MSLHPRMLRFPLILLAVATGGCSAAIDGRTEPVGAAVSAIQGGFNDASDSAVVEVYWAGQLAMCSGSLIGPNLVLTARHCVAPVDNQIADTVDCSTAAFGANGQPTEFFVSTKQTESNRLKDWHTVSQVLTAPDTTFCGFDHAVLVLDDLVSASEATPLVPRVDSPIAANYPYSAIGFGTTDDTNGAGQRRRLDGLLVNCTGSACDPAAVVPEREWMGDHGICEGDSGGPAIDAEGRVIGVTSRGGMGCTTPVYGDIMASADWLKSTALQVASDSGYAPADWATGSSTDPRVGYACALHGGNPSKPLPWLMVVAALGLASWRRRR